MGRYNSLKILSFHSVAIFPELGFTSRDIKHVCICLLSVTLKAQISAILPRELPRRKRSKDDKSLRDCKRELGENDHRSPSNRAQGHAYRQNACGVTSPTSRPQRHQKKKVFQNSAYMLKFVDKPNETIKYIWQSR